ncbi:MAG: glycoside hydrolase family 43 protein [Terricaulis sp.]|nr:glycoside hydrolase family 43 protein [Terricaulis sp.]
MRAVFAGLALAFLSACATAPAQGAGARFAWFEYAGEDGVFAAPLPQGGYRNPIIAGFHPDPSIVRVGEDYYLINSTFGFYPGIPIFHSRDLVNWAQIGNAINRPEMMPFDGLHLGYNGIYAPAIEHRDGAFYIITTCIGCGGNFVITARDPAGPWSDPIWLPHVPGIDPSIFFDDDGRTYIVHHADPPHKAYDAHTALWVMEVDPESFAQISDDVMLVDGATEAPWRTEYLEGPHIYKIDGRYYLWAAGGGTGYFHGQLVYRSESVFGPYEPYSGNSVLTQLGLADDRPDPITATGHADLFQDSNGDWWAVFLATRPFDLAPPNTDPGFFHTGRETFLLPVTWRDGWPIVLEHGAVVPHIAQGPNVPRHAAPRPTTGNFTARDEFDAEALGREWLFIRTPHARWWRSGDGALTLEPRDARMGDSAQPSFIGRRVAHMNSSAATALRFDPAANSEAGLMAVQNDAHYAAFGLARNAAGETVLRVRQRAGGDDPARGIVLAEAPVAARGEIYLRIEINEAHARYSYSLDGRRFTPLLENADALPLTTARAGGFTGLVIGMYAEGAP